VAALRAPEIFHRQNSRNPARCQRTIVLGLTIASVPSPGKNRLKHDQRKFRRRRGPPSAFLRSWYSASCRRRNRFSAMIPERLRNPIRTRSRASARKSKKRAGKRISLRQDEADVSNTLTHVFAVRTEYFPQDRDGVPVLRGFRCYVLLRMRKHAVQALGTGSSSPVFHGPAWAFSNKVKQSEGISQLAAPLPEIRRGKRWRA